MSATVSGSAMTLPPFAQQCRKSSLGDRICIAFERDRRAGKFDLHGAAHIMYPAVQPPSTASTWPLM